MLRAYETALQPSLDENRALNEVETTTIGECRSNLEQIDHLLHTYNEAETTFARAATPTPGNVPGNRPGTSLTLRTQRDHPMISIERRDRFKGCDFTRMAIAMAVAGPWNAAQFAQMRWDDDELSDVIKMTVHNQLVTRAAVPPMTSIEGLPGGGSFLVRITQLQEVFIELLRPELIVGRMPAMRRLNFNNAGSLLIPRQSGGVSGGYVGEGALIQVNRLNFGQMQLIPSKLAVIVPQTSELLRRSDPSTEQLIRDDMIQGTAQTIDNIFFSISTATPGPAGILAPPVPPLVPPLGPLDAGRILPDPGAGPPGGVTQVTEALKTMILALRMANIKMTAPVWIMNTRTKEYLRLLRTTQEIFAFKAEIDAGTLLGYPIIDTTSIPIGTWGEPAPTTVYALIDASQIIWADDMGAQIDASMDASILMDDAPPGTPPPAVPIPAASPIWSAFQNDMIFMRLRLSHTWARRHDRAVVWAYADE